MARGASQNAVIQTEKGRAQNTRLAATVMVIHSVEVDMAHKAGGFKVGYACMVSFAEIARGMKDLAASRPAHADIGLGKLVLEN